MTLFWSDVPYDDSASVIKSAKSVVVNPLQFVTEPEDSVFTHRQLNGRGMDNHLGWIDSIGFVLSEDVFASTATVGSQTVYVRELIFGWERAVFKWIQHPQVNGGEVLQVKFTEKPIRTHPEYDFLNETEYKMIGDVFHANR